MQNNAVKLRLQFDGWHCLPKKAQHEILDLSRKKFINANFFENNGLLIEGMDEMSIHSFCFYIVNTYKQFLGSWDGYVIKKLSKRFLFNYADRKRKLNKDYFKKLVKTNTLDVIKIILAGILYLEPDQAKDILITIEKDFDDTFKNMDDKELDDAYHIVLTYASKISRKFSLNK